MYLKETYLDGVILERSSPIVLMTLRPHTQSPILIPTPPNIRIQIGVSAFCKALPSVPIIQILTRGPMALL